VTDGVQRDGACPHLLVLGDWRLAPLCPLRDAGGCHQCAVRIIAVRRWDIGLAYQRSASKTRSGDGGNPKNNVDTDDAIWDHSISLDPNSFERK
jgi:hypothetical protein